MWIVANSPQNCIVIKTSCNIRKGVVRFGRRWFSLSTPKESYNLSTVTTNIGAESCSRNSVGYPILHCPEHCLFIKSTRLNIGERVICPYGFWAAICAPKESDNLSAVAGCSRAKMRGIDSVCNTIINCPKNRIIVVITRTNINKWILRCKRDWRNT